MTDVASGKWFLHMDFGTEKQRRGDGTNALHPWRVQWRFTQCKPKHLFSVSPSKFNLLFIFPKRPLGGAVSVNKQAADSKKGQTMKVKIQGFVE